jgi:hypothetical protein
VFLDESGASTQMTRRYGRSPIGQRLPPQRRLSQRYREKFKAAGYEFGGSVMNVLRCPACPKDAKPDPDKAALKAGIVEIMGDDEDGIAATMEDFGL